MSFRTRLTWFFIVIVIVPMVAVAVVLFRLVSDSERGKSDARLAQAQTAATALFGDAQDRAARIGRRIAQSRDLATAVESRSRRRIDAQLDVLVRREDAARAILRLEGRGAFRSGMGAALGGATTTLLDRQGREVGSLQVASMSVGGFARELRTHTRMHVAVLAGDRLLSTTLRGLGPSDVPGRGEIEFGGQRYRLANFSAPQFGGGERLSIRLLSDARDTQAAVTEDSLLVAALLLAFLVLAFAFALAVSRSLQAQIQRLLEAARRLGSGEFRIEVPTEGNDEFAQLGSEFNAMARQLEARLEDLRMERARLQHAIRRVGESFAKGLDRDALLRIVVTTAVDGTGADAGRATVRDGADGTFKERASAGNLGDYRDALQAVEAAVLDARQPAETVVGGRHALAHPLQPSDGGNRVVGVISVARNSRAFSDGEKELFSYLASQAAVSIENVDLHETVQRQAVTDELTGLFNHRRFQEVVGAEVERARRFNTSLGLIMFDIDNFKSVNDTYGHLQGDLVLKEVARVLRESAREVDEPARYGGEEMAVALPQTDLEGAYRFAERVRRRIEALKIAKVDGDGTLSVTASFGAAAVPESVTADKDALVAAADQALYQAKNAGKNRVVKAG